MGNIEIQDYGEAWVKYMVMVSCQFHSPGLGLDLGFGKFYRKYIVIIRVRVWL